MSHPKISICIPAFNRPEEVIHLLESIVAQGRGDWDVVVCEDKSPRGSEIKSAVIDFTIRYPELPIRYETNNRNLGYDGNIRRLLDTATGEYSLFMGDDDILAPGSLERVVKAVSDQKIGFVLRAWKSVDKNTGKDIEEHRYFPNDKYFLPGANSIAALFRRSVFISGLTFHRESARSFHTDRFDGTLLYQLYLVGRILARMSGYYISDIVALRRVGGDHFFGSSDSEKGRFRPMQLLPSHSIAFLRGMFEIAKYLDDGNIAPDVGSLIARDLGRYSYPMLEIQARILSRGEFRNYAQNLVSMGFGRYPHYWFYYFSLLALGPNICNGTIRLIKKVLSRTPNLGGSTGVDAS